MNSITITIGKKKRLLSFGLKMVSELLAHTGDSIGDFGRRMRNNPFETTPLIIFYAAKNGSESLKAVPDFSLVDVYGWIEEVSLKDKGLLDAITVFSKSLTVFVKDLYPEVKEAEEQNDDSKKK